MRKFLASVGNAKLIGKVDGVYTHIADVRTLTESTLSFSNTQEEIRAGEGAKLYGRFSHDSGMTCTLTDAMFDIDYVSLQVGAAIKGNDAAVTGLYNKDTFENAGSTITLSKEPQDIGSACGLDKCFVWIREKGCKADQDWVAVPATKGSKTVDLAGTAFVGKDICTEYFVDKPGNRAIQIKANFIPAELILILTTKLFAGDANAPETGKPYGEITVKIPRFSLDGNFDLSMAMSSAASISLAGTALTVDDGSCEGNGVYAEIVEIIDSNTVMTGLKDIIVDEDTLVVGSKPGVYGSYNGGAISKIDSDSYTVSTSGGVSSDDKLVAGTNYVTVSIDGGAYTTDGSTVLPANTYKVGDYMIDVVTVS